MHHYSKTQLFLFTPACLRRLPLAWEDFSPSQRSSFGSGSSPAHQHPRSFKKQTISPLPSSLDDPNRSRALVEKAPKNFSWFESTSATRNKGWISNGKETRFLGEPPDILLNLPPLPKKTKKLKKGSRKEKGFTLLALGFLGQVRKTGARVRPSRGWSVFFPPKVFFRC
ncbi:hypothetical protein IE53DRAFT_254177 [Violaceomyces palustris]|uniref:Uncharacterized protein n=1 Tax=Violaceomyces palustris TaxID=1673888 RepID=A0ACD0NNH5_9BASI|nr:hypothetical protein IE53DRAFT_254177 [Violaceomyces palustris]